MSTLHQAARAGDLSELRRLFESGAAIDARDPKTGHTPLMAACLSPDAGLEAVRVLLDRGADLHARVRQEADPVATIHRALDELDPDTRLQIDAEMDALLDQTGVTPAVREIINQSRQTGGGGSTTQPEAPALISLAVAESSCEKIRLLIERGADLDYRSAHGYTLLTTAACHGREDVIDLLLAAGAPLDGQSDYQESALSVLSRMGRFGEIRKILVHGADPTPLEWTPLHRAVALGTLAEVKDLLDEGADPQAIDFWERSAFLLAVHAGDTEKASLLVSRGANRDATGRCGKPFLPKVKLAFDFAR